MNPSGTHVLQSLIESMNQNDVHSLFSNCNKNEIIKMALVKIISFFYFFYFNIFYLILIFFIQDINATHVIQKFIIKVNEEKRQEINYILLENFRTFVKDANGICVLKKFISSNKSEIIKVEIYTEIKKDIFETIKNPYGNYIIQMIIDVIKFLKFN